jgi:hypothetical protein
MLCDLGFLHAGGDRRCPPMTSGSRFEDQPHGDKTLVVDVGSDAH